MKANRGANDDNKPSEATDDNARSPDADEAPNTPVPQGDNSHQATASSPSVGGTETSAPGGRSRPNEPELQERVARQRPWWKWSTALGLGLAAATVVIALVSLLNDLREKVPNSAPTIAPSSGALPSGPILRASSSGATTNQTLLRLDAPKGVQENDVLIAQVHGRGRQPIKPPEGWRRIDRIESSGDNMESFWKVATGREPPSYDFDTQHLNGKGGGIIAWQGVDPVDPIDDTSLQSGVGTTQVVVPGVTTSAPGSPLILMLGVIGETSVTKPSDMDERWIEVSPPGEFRSTTACSTRVQIAASESGEKLAEVGGAEGFGGWVAQLIALRPVTTTG